MFLGHYGVAFGAKRAAPRVGLGVLILAAQWADLLWPILLLVGVERVAFTPGITAMNPLDFVHYPISHSLAALIAWGAALGVVYGAATKSRAAGWVVGGVVVSHWLLDLFVHRPDLPIFPGGVRVGLGLWNIPAATIALEAILLALGVLLYARATAPRDRVGNLALWTLVLFLLIVYVASVVGPPPPNTASLATVGLAGWLFVPWGYWIDRHRRPA